MEAFAVISSVPEAEESEVARDTAVTVTFSAPIDADTVSSDSFRLVGPDGPVTGTLEVHDSEVVFAPAAPLAIFADYELQLSASLAASDGGDLEEDQVVAFRTRDGVFGKPKRITSAKTVNLDVQGTVSGHERLSWMDGLTSQSRIVTFFNPASGAWTVPGPVETKTDGDYGWGCVVLNDQGDAFALLGSNVPPIWNRAKVGVWDAEKPAPQPVSGSCALADDGTAMSLWERTVDNDWAVFAASLSPNDEWSEPKTLQLKARVRGVIPYGAGFLAFHALEAGGMVANEYDPKVGWLPAKPVTDPGIHTNYWHSSVLSPAVLLTWNGPDDLVYVSSFDGTAWTSQELGPGGGGTKTSISSRGRLAGWLNQGSAYLVQGDVDGNWQDPVKLGPTNSEDYGPAVTIDSSGNSLAAWPNGSSISWRRSLHDAPTEWSDVEEMPDQDPYVVFSTVDSGGNVMLIWSNPLGLWASRFE
jgi:hypothetical protein